MKGKLLLLGLCCAVSWSSAADPFYDRQPTLTGTMLATRERYVSWQSTQKLARTQVQWCPWSKDGAPQDGWKDGSILLLSEEPSTRSATLSRSIVATKPLNITVGLGGGDKIEVRLNGKPVATLDTHLELKRYGTSMRLEGDRRNQVLVDLPLTAGENRLVLRVNQQTVGSRATALQFFFSAAPDPLPALWARIRGNFPDEPLLAAVHFHWFESPGWFDPATGIQLEKQFLDSDRATTERSPSSISLGGRPSVAAALDSTGETGMLEQCAAAADQAALHDGLAKLRLAVAQLGKSFPEYPSTAFLKRLEADKNVRLTDLERLRREMLVEANPLLKGRKLLFARRHTYDSQHYYDDYYHGPTAWGGNLTELDLATGKTRDIVPQLNGGIFDRFDLSPDGKRVVFGYRPCKPDGFRIWELNLDSVGLRQLTHPPEDEAERIDQHSGYSRVALSKDPRLYGHWTDDMHPCYLPDGGIAFVSSRPECSVLCGDHALTCTTLYRMDANGENLRPLSQGALTESSPTILDDGRILYTRWEYVYKGIAAVQSLWTMRPDGTGSEEVYGLNIDNPGVFFAGRQIPGRPDLIVAAGVGHEPLNVGSIRVIDRKKDRRTKDAMTTLTPEVETRGLRGLYQFRNGRWTEDVYGSFYCDPYPLSENFFLVSHNEGRRYNDPQAYGVWLLDSFGNRVLIYQDPEMSCFQPMLEEPRTEAPKLPSLAVDESAKAEATVLLVDLYRNLQGVAPGTVKYLRVMEQIPRSWVASQIKPGDTVPGQSPAISLHTHIWVGVLLGIVPVESDGSALFKVPAHRNLFFTALDKDFMEVQKMRSFVNFQPGETRSCVGCHDSRDGSPVPEHPLATLHPPHGIGPQPGDSGPRPIHYASDVQPLLDAHCVRCHGTEKPGGDLDLSGEYTEVFNHSYENLLRKGLVNFIQEWTGPVPEKRGPAYAGNGSMMHSEAVPPYTYGSHKSRLIEVLRKGHYDVALPREDFIKLTTWVDANAPFYGSYFGRRNIAAKDRPDFRPVPTLDSARGIPPHSITPTPIPAELIASWKSNDLPDRFDGKNFVQGKAAGTLEAVSVALWVLASELKNTWNPLLFTDGFGASSFHFSLLQDGTPNVAVNSGGKLWIHNRSSSAVAPGAWHHVAVVCDARSGGVTRFYINGQLAGTRTLDADVPLDFSAYRLGAWKSWQGNPANNFHGSLADVRLYHGLLTKTQVTELARAAQPLTAQTGRP